MFKKGLTAVAIMGMLLLSANATNVIVEDEKAIVVVKTDTIMVKSSDDNVPTVKTAAAKTDTITKSSDDNVPTV
ncbi:hypothetical protein ACSVDA_21370 [Cytobacillus sp. Hm23]